MALVVHKDRDAVLALLQVRGMQFHHQIAHFLARVLLVNRELVVIALAQAAKFFDFVVVARDQRAELAPGHLQIILGAVQVGLHAVDVRADLVHVINACLGRQLCIGLILHFRQFLGVVFLDLLGLRARFG